MKIKATKGKAMAKKLCPLKFNIKNISPNPRTVDRYCEEDQCAWWCDIERCAILDIAYNTYDIKEDL